MTGVTSGVFNLAIAFLTKHLAPNFNNQETKASNSKSQNTSAGSIVSHSKNFEEFASH